MGFEIPQTLIDEITKGRASLLLGAGASREANFPSAEELSDHLATKAGASYSTILAGQPLDAVAQHLYFQPGYGKQWVRQQIIDLFDSKHREVKRPPSHAHETMTKIRWRTIFTTNYDRLVEIAYDSSSQGVQRLLPIYAPDPQILRHETDVVRFIKLNGSVDEAARNSTHELVLTFAEQQDAYSRNEAFYNLLREEAIHGPIIFVGFRFVHPGSYIPGSSPEFQQLRDLLRAMGPAARWHYCVNPFDPSLPTAKTTSNTFYANQVAVINATFGEFLDALTAQLKVPIIPLVNRPPIVVPVGQKSLKIEAEEYGRDKRHFEILGTHLEELTPPSVAKSLNGHETWASFLQGHLIRRLCKNDIYTAILSTTRNAPQIFFLSAPPGWGKTFLLRDIAVDFYRAKRPVLWLNPHSVLEVDGGGKNPITLGKWDSLRIDHIISMIADAAANQNEDATPIIIADNCPERAKEVLALFRDLTSNSRSFVLIFSVRDNEFDSLVDEYPLLKKARQFRPIEHYDSKEEVRELIDFCTQHRIATIEDPAQREVVAQRIISEEANTALILALQVIFDKNHRPFSEIVKDFWQSLQNESARKLVLRVASLHRFGSAFSPRLYSLLRTFSPHNQAEVLKVYRECLDKSILFERIDQEEPCVYTLHSLVAEHIVKVSESNAIEIDNELIGVIKCMTGNARDLEIIRQMLKSITDYEINLSSEEKTTNLLLAAADSTNFDWVVCQQIAKYLVQRDVHESALAFVERALESNPDHAPLHHTKGNVLKRWGVQFLKEGEIDQARSKFEEARQCFAISRIRREADEYGYVTHLDMVLYLLDREKNEFQKANLLAEGVQLYNEGIRSVPKDQFKFLLEERFQRTFDLTGETTNELCSTIEEALALGKSSVYAAAFLADQFYNRGEYVHAIQILQKQRQVNDRGILAWIKEAELNAREGDFSEAAKCIDSARRRENAAENAEALWSLMYWNVLVATARENFQEAREASIRLANSGFFSKLFSRQFFPRGYIWKEAARIVKPENRSFKEHAKIWSGRIERIRAGDRYGQIALTNIIGETFNIDFNPRYFSRGDLRRGDRVEFVITILPNRLRADDVNSKPFLNTIDDLFVR
jgi:tetratricopeptide (TPR) repeat protein